MASTEDRLRKAEEEIRFLKSQLKRFETGEAPQLSSFTLNALARACDLDDIGTVRTALEFEAARLLDPRLTAGRSALLAHDLTLNDSIGLTEYDDTPLGVGYKTLREGFTFPLLFKRPDGVIYPLSNYFTNAKLKHYIGDTHDQIPFTGAWVNYASSRGNCMFFQDMLGCVFLSGLAKSGAIGSVIFNIPEFWADTQYDAVWCTLSNNAFGRLDKRDTGTFNTAFAVTGNNAWYSVNNIMYPARNRINWHNVGDAGEPAFENGWVNYGAGYNPARFGKDAAGRVWVQGLIKNGNSGQVAFTLPEQYRPSQYVYVESASNPNVFARLVVLSNGSVIPTTAAGGANIYHSVETMFVADSPADVSRWYEIGDINGIQFQNGWVNYSATKTTYETAGFCKDMCGIVHVKGFVKSGAGTVFTLPKGYRPARTQLMPTMTHNNVLGRIQIDRDGSITISLLGAGTNGWVSLHHSFLAEW
jgi:hypothetical protein